MINFEVLVVTACHNRARTTEVFAKLLLAQTHPNWRMVLVDDGSTDDSVVRMRQLLGDRLVVVRGDGALFWGGGIEAGLHAAGALAATAGHRCAVAVMNDDVEFSPALLQKQVELLADSPPKTCLVTRHIENPGKRNYIGFSFDQKTLKTRDEADVRDCHCFTTRSLCFLYEPASYPTMNGRRYPHYWSDLDFTLRMFKSGWHFAEVPGEQILYVNQFREGRLYRGLAGWARLMSWRCPTNPVAVARFIAEHAAPGRKSVLQLKAWAKVPIKLITGVH
jgi:GT2 family glycosyltransferase